MVENLFCPHCKQRVIISDIETKNCPSCKGTIERFKLNSFAEKNIHLFEIIGIFGAIAILMPTLVLGLKDIFNSEPTQHQIFILGLTLTLGAALLLVFWLLVLYNLNEQRKLSPVKRFFSIFGDKNFSIRQGDEQVYLFSLFFAPIYFLVMDYIFTLSNTLALVVMVAPILSLGILSMIFDFLCRPQK